MNLFDRGFLKDSCKNLMLAVVLVSIIIFLCLYFTPYSSDDYIYMTNLTLNDGTKIMNIRDICSSVYTHYYTWGGRIVATFMIQLILFIGKPFSSLFITFVYVGLALMCSYLASKYRKISVYAFLFFSSMFYFLNPNWQETVLWETGSITYLFSTFLVVLFIILYISDSQSPSHIILLVFVGLLAGCTNEHIAPATFCAMALYELINYRKLKKVNSGRIMGLVGILIGGALLILAPGNFVRMNDYSTHTWWYSLALRIWEQILMNFKHGFFAISLLYFSLIITKKLDKLAISLIVLGHLATFAMFMTELFPTRAFTPIVIIFLVVIWLCLINSDLFDKYKYKFQYLLYYAFTGFILTNIYYIIFQIIH